MEKRIKSKIKQFRVLIKRIKRGKAIAITSKFCTKQDQYTIAANSKSQHTAIQHIDGASNFIHIY